MEKVIIHPGEDGFWVAECPDLPGCISQGKTKREARANIHEAIEGYLEAIESNPKFIEMMERSEADIRKGCFVTQEEVEKRFGLRKKGKKSKKKR